ncbi:MAG TPA: ABC transporter permease subunit [Micromonosporaceae bacterium]
MPGPRESLRAHLLRGPAAVWPAAATALAAALVWWAIAAGRPQTVLPSPWTTAHTVADLLVGGQLLGVVGRTAAVMAVGFTASALLGICLGLLIGTVRTLDRALSPYLVGLQSLPSAIWIPLAVILLGTSDAAVLAVTVLGAVPSIAMGTRNAVHAVPPPLIRAARMLGEAGAALVVRVVLPAALPGIAAGIEQGWAFAFRSLVAGELILGTVGGSGIGVFLTEARAANRVDRMLAAVLAILVLGLLVDRLGFRRWQRLLRRRRGVLPEKAT